MIQATKFVVDITWKVVLKDLGINPTEILRHAQLPGDIFSRQNATLSAGEYFQLWRSLEESLNDSCFPLRLGQMISTESFSPPIFAALCSPNLTVAMGRLSSYKQLIGPMTLTVDQYTKETTITLDCLYSSNPLPDSLVATELVFLVHLVRLATREPIVPLAISSTQTFSYQDEYVKYFGVVPTKDKVNQLTFSAQDAKIPFVTESESMWRFFEPELRKRLADIDSETTFAGRVHSSLFELLPSGLSSIDDVAKKLAVSKRSLQRHLSKENTCFQLELNRTREKLARHYLRTTKLPSSQISFLLGFDDPNSFIRAFRSWTGTTPESIRKL